MPGSSLGRHLESGVDPGNEVAVVFPNSPLFRSKTAALLLRNVQIKNSKISEQCIDKFKTFLFPVNLLCVSKLNKFVFNQYMMFRFINI